MVSTGSLGRRGMECQGCFLACGIRSPEKQTISAVHRGREHRFRRRIARDPSRLRWSLACHGDIPPQRHAAQEWHNANGLKTSKELRSLPGFRSDDLRGETALVSGCGTAYTCGGHARKSPDRNDKPIVDPPLVDSPLACPKERDPIRQQTGPVMPIAQTAQIHATAIVSPEADLADGVQVGPYAVLEGKVTLGSGCVVRPGTYLIGPLTMGRDNTVYSGASWAKRRSIPNTRTNRPGSTSAITIFSANT